MNPEMLKALMPMLAGAGIAPMVQNIEKLLKTLTGGGAAAKGQKQAMGPQAATPAPMPMPSAGGTPSQLDPTVLAMLTRMMAARGGAGA